MSIKNVNLINQNASLTKSKYLIPLIAPEFNNTNLLGNVYFDARRKVMTPIFQYEMGYSENGGYGDITLERGSADNYSSYNPSVFATPVAAQMGGYLNQLNSYEEAFHNMDTYMIMPRAQRLALKYRNQYAAEIKN